MTYVINWTRAIATNRKALGQVVEEIFGLIELALAKPTPSLPPLIQSMVLRLLRPAESAVRRLIIIMAKDVKVKLPPKRPMPKGLKITRSGSSAMRFRLYDQRKRLNAPPKEKPEAKGPRIHFFYDRGPLLQYVFTKKTKPKGTNIFKRCAALKSALETLPTQAKRMALWRLRRETKTNVKFKSPLRPGQPPGHQRRPRLDIDRILATCHGLADEVLYPNTS